MRRRSLRGAFLFVLLVKILAAHAVSIAAPTVDEALKLAPVQQEVDFDKPAPDKIAQCKLESLADQGGWTVYSDTGQVIRRFLDTNKDHKLDQWCYYKNGIEVYRDLDTNHNGKADQYRWLGTAGLRWGLDANEDGKIDSWKAISPEEVSAEVVAALRDKNLARFQRLLLSSDELTALGTGPKQAEDFRDRIASAKNGFAELAKNQRIVESKSQWIQFGASRPGVIPAGTDGSVKDVLIYDNVAAIVETDSRHTQVFVGTLVNVGTGWRLVDLPKSEATDGTFVSLVNRPAGDGAAAGQPNEAMQKLIADLERIDTALLSESGDKAALHAQRASALEQLARSATADADRAMWIKQFADMVAAAVQSGDFPTGIDKLKNMLAQLSSDEKAKDLVPYVKFRHLASEYGQRLAQAKEADYAKVQEQWIKDLEQFVNDYPQAEDAPEALLQVALGQEFAGQEEQAAKTYGRITSGFPKSEQAKKAGGAKFRLESVGKSMQLQGKTIEAQPFDLAQYRGRVVVIQYWATWSELCKQDMQQLKTLQTKLGQKGFAVVGVNLDNDVHAASKYLAASRWPWPQLYENGGMDSRLANEMGIQTLPTMILVDKAGRVVRRNIHATELEAEIEKLLK